MSATTNTLTTAAERAIRQLRRMTPAERVAAANQLHEECLQVQADIASVKTGAVRELRHQGWTFAEIANELGISQSRVKQIDAAERKGGHNGH